MKALVRNPIFAAIGFAAAIAVAPASYAFQDEGDKEIEFTGGFSHTDGTDIGIANADVSFGYYWAPRLNFGIRQTLNYAFVEDGADQWNASTIPFVNYNFETSNPNLRPFIGAFVGGFLFGLVGVSAGSGLIGSLITAVIGAAVLLFIVGLIKRA